MKVRIEEEKLRRVQPEGAAKLFCYGLGLGARPKTEIPILALVFKEISYLLITFEDTGEVRRGSPVNMVGCIYAPY